MKAQCFDLLSILVCNFIAFPPFDTPVLSRKDFKREGLSEERISGNEDTRENPELFQNGHHFLLCSVCSPPFPFLSKESVLVAGADY